MGVQLLVADDGTVQRAVLDGEVVTVKPGERLVNVGTKAPVLVTAEKRDDQGKVVPPALLVYADLQEKVPTQTKPVDLPNGFATLSAFVDITAHTDPKQMLHVQLERSHDGGKTWIPSGGFSRPGHQPVLGLDGKIATEAGAEFKYLDEFGNPVPVDACLLRSTVTIETATLGTVFRVDTK